MAEVKDPQRVIPIVGLISATDFRADIFAELEGQLGQVVLKSGSFSFCHTTYYDQEMGSGLTRQWCAFGNLVMPDTLVDLKHMTNTLEKKYPNRHGGRSVNIDPGMVSLSNLVLASTKNYSHRVYLGRGIYAEVTLIFKQKQFVPLDWTYPDYREEAALEFFTAVRAILRDRMIESQGNMVKE
jgi:hypothetical protein